MTSQIIAQGAEAIIHKDGHLVEKVRVVKGYRHPELDKKMRKHQTRREAKVLHQLQDSGFTPHLVHADEKEGSLLMHHIDGNALVHCLTLEHMKQVGSHVATIHNKSIIHGDLTTSNMIVKEDKVFLIDFGLSFQSDKIEDKAVDLHVLKEALQAKHFEMHEQAFASFLESYVSIATDGTAVVKRLEVVEKRGRYKHKHK